jgi:hypothetical protein
VQLKSDSSISKPSLFKIDPDDYLRKRRSAEMDIDDLTYYALSSIESFGKKFADD